MSGQMNISKCCTVSLLMALMLAAAGCQKLTPQQKALKQVESARNDVQRGNVTRAMIEYRQAIQNDPKLAIAHFEIGKLYENNHDLVNAYRELSQAVNLDGSNREARKMLAQLLLAGRSYNDAKTQADAILAQKHDDPEGLMILAQSLIGMQQTADARMTVERLLQLVPKNGRARVLLAALQFQRGEIDQGERSLRQGIEDDPTQVGAAAALARFLIQQGKKAEAEATIRQAVANNPQSVAAQYLLAGFLWKQNRLPEAEIVFRKIKVMGEKEPWNRSALARFYTATNRSDLAEKEYLQIVAKHPDDVVNQRALAMHYFAANQLPAAEQAIQTILKVHPDDPQTLLLAGQLRLKQGRLEDAVSEFQHAARTQPRWALAHYYVATGEVRRGQLRMAEAELQSALELDPNLTSARALLASIELNDGELKRALADVNKVVAAKPNDIRPYIMRSVLLAQQGDASEAEKALLPLLNDFPATMTQATTYRALAWVKLDQKRYEEARKFLTRAWEAEPNSRETLYLIGLSYLAERNPDQARAVVESKLRNSPQWAEGYEVGGELMVSAGRPADAEQLLEKALAINPKLRPARLALAEAQSFEAKYDQALGTLTKLAQEEPKWALAYLRLGQLQDRRQAWSEGEVAYQKVLELEPDNVIAKNNLAWDYAQHAGNIDVALRLAQEAKEARPDDPSISDTLGWIYVKKETLGNAIQLLEECVAKRPNDPEYNYHLGVAYLKAGRMPQAKQYLQSALKLEPKFVDADDANRLLVSLNR